MRFACNNIPLCINFRLSLVWLFVLPMALSYGQSTPKELGRLMFACVKNQSVNCINAYLPTQEEYRKIVKALKLHGMKSDSEMVSSYLNDIVVFKSLLQQIYTDSLGLQIDWRKARLKKIATKNFSMPVDTSISYQLNHLAITEVKIIFTVNTLDYVLFLPSVWKCEDKWKLGNQILYGNADFIYGSDFKF